MGSTGSLALFLDPHYVSVNAWRTQTVLLLLLTAVLATAVARSRNLLRRQVADHVARANLARYFSPTVVDVLASAGPTGTAARREPVAVLFADIKGFTAASESLGAEAAMELLQEFHHHVTRVVFQHRGTLEKYIGDAVMATFGTPSAEPDDASRALRCAWQLLGETRRWSEQRVARGATPVQIGIGINYGEAVVGSLGDGQRLDYAIIGDSVNVASRLQRLTRELDVEIVVSDDLVTQIHKEGSPVDALLRRFTRGGDVHVRGRVHPVTLWTARDQASIPSGQRPHGDSPSRREAVPRQDSASHVRKSRREQGADAVPGDLNADTHEDERGETHENARTGGPQESGQALSVAV